MRNPTALRDYTHWLADATGAVLDRGGLPIVLGGDCSILLGGLLALHRRGRHGLLVALNIRPRADTGAQLQCQRRPLPPARRPESVGAGRPRA